MAASADQIKLILHPELWDSLIKDQDLVYTSLTDPKIGQVYDEILEDKHALINHFRDCGSLDAWYWKYKQKFEVPWV